MLRVRGRPWALWVTVADRQVGHVEDTEVVLVATLVGMTITPDYRELHRAVDRLKPEQAEALFVVVESMLGKMAVAEGSAPVAPRRRGHRLSFTGAGEGPSDLAERAEEYLGGFGDSSR
jgi:hypothetical protein